MSKPPYTMDFTEFNKDFFPLVEKRIPHAAENGLVNAAHEMLRDADKEAPQTPKEFGDLRGSRRVEDPKITSDTISVKAGYTIKYAKRHHEVEPGTYKYTRNKGADRPGPKFLITKMQRHKKKYIQTVANTINDEA